MQYGCQGSFRKIIMLATCDIYGVTLVIYYNSYTFPHLYFSQTIYCMLKFRFMAVEKVMPPPQTYALNQFIRKSVPP